MREELISVVAGLCLLLPVTSRAAPLAGRTLAVAVEVDRDGARLLSYTLKGRPFDTAAEKPGSTEAADELEVALVAGKEVQHRRVVALHGLCLQHAPDAAPHIQGDTIQLHRDSFIVELPELKGADKIEIAHHTRTPTGLVRRLLKAETLDAARFLPATDGFRY
jgi:hypothetical protein